MNTDKLKEYIRGELQLLPKELREAIDIFDWEKIAEDIGKNYKLTEGEILALQTETALVLVGLVKQTFFVQNIENNVGTSKEEAEKISGEINQKIFKPMVDMLTENIKKNLGNKPIHWQQNLDFILSGGDYTAFIRRIGGQAEDISNLKKEFNPSKIDDLKSRFTI